MTAWRDMIDRCENKKNPYYQSYGGRGITVCEHWHIFSDFYADMGEPPSQDYSLDRIDNNKGYGPGNCRWTDITTQSRNTRKNRLLTYKGETKCLAEWAEILGLSVSCICSRLRYNWSFDKIVETPPHSKTSRYRGVYKKGPSWVAQISEDGVRTCIGYFASETEAAKAFNSAASRIYGARAKLNII